MLLALVVAVHAPGPRLIVADDVPNDLRTLASDVWVEFVAAFPAEGDCIGEVELAMDSGMADRARYVPSERRVVVRVPGTAANLSASITHELGHHLEVACTDQMTVRASFLEADRLGEDTPWFGEGDWFASPSEHWAEAVVEYVLGERTLYRGRVPVSAEAVEVVARWAAESG